MPIVQYEQTFSRTIDVEVTDEQLQALRDSAEVGTPAGEAQADARQFVTDTALANLDKLYPMRNESGLEFVMAVAIYEDPQDGYVELFDI